MLPSQTCFILLACLGFWNTHVTRGCGTCRQSSLLRHSIAPLGLWRIFVLLVHSIESEHCFWLDTWTAEICCTVVLTSVLEQLGFAVIQGNMFVQRLLLHAQCVIFSRDHTRPPRLSFALALSLTMNARNASKDICWELLTLRSLVDQSQWWTQCVLQWLAQSALVAYLTQALIARTDIPTCHVSFSEKDDDSILRTHHHLCRIVSHRNTHKSCSHWLKWPRWPCGCRWCGSSIARRSSADNNCELLQSERCQRLTRVFLQPDFVLSAEVVGEPEVLAGRMPEG